ncbi:MAG TPA: transferase hexapeptide repeat family protein [Steroidobacteraceae bacterium]|nr:transferase hexapeptide repeat family protein [Steroidobacteraceae bacterium]
MPIYALEGVVPVVDPTAFVHPLAVLIGDVIVGPRCYIGPGASLRGDFGRIVLGTGSNVQDNCVLHTFPAKEVRLEEDAHIGHGAVLHGCTIKRGALVGINAVVMDDVVVGEESLVGAASFVRAKFVVPRRTLVTGAPARVVRDLTEEEVAWKAAGTREYQDLAERCLKSLKQCEPLTHVPPDREKASERAVNTQPLHALRKK